MMQRSLALGILTAGAAWSGAAHAGWQDGYLSITNVRHDTVRVVINGRALGAIGAGDAEAYRLPPGTHSVQVLDSRGATVERQSVSIAPYSAQAILLDPPTSELDITNHSGGRLRIWVDGEAVQVLSPGQSYDLRVSPGAHEVRATYRQHDQRRELLAASYRVRPGEVEHISLGPPQTSLLEVVNPSPIPGRVEINGRYVGAVGPGQTTFVEAPIGTVEVSIKGARGERLERERVTIRPFEDQTVRAQYATHGALSVSNPLPIPVQLRSGQQQRILQPGETARWDRVPSGPREIDVYRLTGEQIGEMSVTIRGGDTARASVSPPTEGILLVNNNSNLTAAVFVDGRLVEHIPAGSIARIPARVGPREVRVVAGGRERFDQRLAVDRYAEAEIDVGRGRAYGDSPGRGHGHGRGQGHSRHGGGSVSGEVSVSW